MLGRVRASYLNELGVRAKARGDLDEAIARYHEATEADPSWEYPWFNLGLLEKGRRAWLPSFNYNLEACKRLETTQGEPAVWNLGIAATAVGNWRVARRAWREFGLGGVEDGDGEPRMALGPVPIRLGADTDLPEVVWCERIDPARGIVRSVPLPTSQHRFGDVVLHDGAPNGTRELRGVTVPVFDELARLTPSGLVTFRVLVEADSAVEVAALVEESREGAGAMEDWSNVRKLCKACSEGRPGHQHDAPPTSGVWLRERTIGIAAATEEEAATLLDGWVKAGERRSRSAIERMF